MGVRVQGYGAEKGLGCLGIACVENSFTGCVRGFVTLQPSPSCGPHLILLIIFGRYRLPVGAYVWRRMSSWKMLLSWEMLPLSRADIPACSVSMKFQLCVIGRAPRAHPMFPLAMMIIFHNGK